MTPTLTAAHDAEDVHLPPKLRQKLAAINNECDRALRDEAPINALQLELVLAAKSAVNQCHQSARGAYANLVVFKNNAAAMADRHGRMATLSMILILPVVLIAEIGVVFNGMRFALGRLGEIASPFDDKLSLLAATGFSLITLKLAYTAAIQFTRSQRASMREPCVPQVVVDPGLPRVLTDPDGEKLLRPHPLESGGPAEPPSPPTNGAAATGASEDGDDPEAKRYAHVFCDGISRKVRLTVAAIAVMAGLGMWSMNGVMRAEYNNAVQATATAAMPAAAFGESADTAQTAGSGDAGAKLEAVLIGLGLLLFIAMTVTMIGAVSPLGLRERDLEREAKAAKKNVNRAIKDARKAIRDFESSRGTIIYARRHAANVTETVKADEQEAA